MEAAIIILTNIIWHMFYWYHTDCVDNFKVFSALLPVLPETYFNVFREEKMNLGVVNPTARIQREQTWRRPSPIQVHLNKLECHGKFIISVIQLKLWNFTLDFKQHGFCGSPLFLQTLGPWFPNEMQNLLSSEKRTLDHWATVQLFFSTAQVRCFWRGLWFRSGLVALFLKTSERSDSWCTDSSFSPLLVKLSQVFESAFLDCILKLAVIPVACAPFPTQILPSSQLCI